jgi:hypothetical protein
MWAQVLLYLPVAGGMLLAGKALAEVPPQPGEDKPRLVKVVFEREVSPETLKRYRLTGGIVYLKNAPTEEDLHKQAERAGKIDTTIKIELFFDPKEGRYYYESTVLGKDLIHAAEIKKWEAYAQKNFAVGKDFGGFGYHGIWADLEDDDVYPYHCEERPKLVRFDERYDRVRSERAPSESISLAVTQLQEQPVSQHDFLRLVVRMDCRVDKTSAGYVVVSKDKWGKTTEGGQGQALSWLSGERTIVHLLGLRVSPDKFLPHYGRKFPSALPKNFKLDKTAWGRAEMEHVLAGMKQALDKLPENDARYSLAEYMRATAYVYVPMLEGAENYHASFELLKKQYEVMSKWWEENKENTYWYDRIQKLVARGQTPEELVVAAERQRQEEIKAKLEAPITKEKMQEIRAKLIAGFEADIQRLAKWWKGLSEPDTQNSFTKTEEGRWEWVKQEKLKHVPTRRTYAGPEIKERPSSAKASKRFPLEGRFEGLDVDFYYDKLGDCWRKGPSWLDEE